MKTIIFFGVGIANLAAIKELERQLAERMDEFKFIVVDPKDYVEIPFPMLRAMFDANLGSISRGKIKDSFLNVEHIQSKLKTLKEHSAILDDGQEIHFDYALVATGASTRGFKDLGASYTNTIENREAQLAAQGKEINSANEIIIAGGGVIGVELAGEILSVYPEKKLTILTGADRLLAHLSPSAGKKAYKTLKKLGKNFEAYFNDRIEYKEEMETSEIKKCNTVSGKEYKADLIFLTLGNEYHAGYLEAHFKHTIATNGMIQVDKNLNLEDSKNIFVLGDIANAVASAEGHIAMDQGMHTAKNIVNIINNTPLVPYNVGNSEKITFITLGRKKGIAQLPFGRLDFMIKIKQKDFFAPAVLAFGKAR